MMYKKTDKLTAWYLAIGMISLFIGGSLGPLQKLEHVGINFYSALNKIGLVSYYQGLTIHAVLNALVWTTFFIVGFFTFIIPRSLNKELVWPKVQVLSFILMLLGLVMAAIPILMNLATVLYTFYPPMKANSVILYWTGSRRGWLLGRWLRLLRHLHLLA